jgi:hypothetical protein
MDWQNLLGTAAVVLTLASAAGLGLMRASLANLRNMNDDLTKRVDFLEKEGARNEVEKAELRVELARLQDHEAYLQSVLRGRVDFTAISDQLEAVHALVIRIDRVLNDKGT